MSVSAACSTMWSRIDATCTHEQFCSRHRERAADTGACMAPVMSGRFALLTAIFCLATPTHVMASVTTPTPAATSFAYSLSHAVTPLPDEVIEQTVDADG